MPCPWPQDLSTPFVRGQTLFPQLTRPAPRASAADVGSAGLCVCLAVASSWPAPLPEARSCPTTSPPLLDCLLSGRCTQHPPRTPQVTPHSLPVSLLRLKEANEESALVSGMFLSPADACVERSLCLEHDHFRSTGRAHLSRCPRSPCVLTWDVADCSVYFRGFLPGLHSKL